jgi:hypothetical protein
MQTTGVRIGLKPLKISHVSAFEHKARRKRRSPMVFNIKLGYNKKKPGAQARLAASSPARRGEARHGADAGPGEPRPVLLRRPVPPRRAASNHEPPKANNLGGFLVPPRPYEPLLWILPVGPCGHLCFLDLQLSSNQASMTSPSRGYGKRGRH